MGARCRPGWWRGWCCWYSHQGLRWKGSAVHSPTFGPKCHGNQLFPSWDCISHHADSRADFDILLSSRRTLSPVEVAVNRKLLRKGVNGSPIHPEAGVDIPLSSNRIRSCCRWYRRRRNLVWSPTGFAYRSQPKIIVLLFSNFIIFISHKMQYKFKQKILIF